MRSATGNRSTVTWSADGRTVEKCYLDRRPQLQGLRWHRFEREWRAGQLFGRQPLPAAVRTPRLLGADRRRRALRFEAVDGEVLGPKYPLELPGDGADLEGLVALASATAAYRPRGARFLRRFDLERRVRLAVSAGDLGAVEAAKLRSLAAADPPRYVFGHGDVTARNVIKRAADGAHVLIDWEWVGWYPRGWELAFLWYTLVDLPGGRAQVEAAVPARDEAWFWRSALLVQLLHLHIAPPDSPFRATHVATKDALVERVLDR